MLQYLRDAGGGGGRGACAPPQVLGYQLTLFGPRGADYARHITTGPPSFWAMRRLCRSNENFFNLWEFFIPIFMNKNKAKYVTAFALKSYESEKMAITAVIR